MSFLEYLQYCYNNIIDITKWKIVSLYEKVSTGKSLTPAETCAKLFLEEMGYHSWLADQQKLQQFEESGKQQEKE